MTLPPLSSRTPTATASATNPRTNARETLLAKPCPAERHPAIPEAEAVGPDGQPSAVLVSAIDQVKRLAVLELVFFFVIFTCMILMRFGL